MRDALRYVELRRTCDVCPLTLCLTAMEHLCARVFDLIERCLVDVVINSTELGVSYMLYSDVFTRAGV